MRWLAALLLAVPLTGCAASAADDGRLQVTAGFYPLVWVSERVGGEHVDVTGLTDPGVEPHDIEPTFARTVALARADLVVVEHGLQPAIDEAVAQNAEGRRARRRPTWSACADGRRRRPTRTSGSTPLLLADAGDAVAADLAELDPPNAASYAANATALRADLDDLDAAFASGLADCERHVVVSSHDAFGYWAQVRDRGRPRRRPDPRRRAHAGRPRPAPAADPRRGHHHGVLRAAGQPEAHRFAGPRPRPAHRRPRPDRGAASDDDTPTRTTSR